MYLHWFFINVLKNSQNYCFRQKHDINIYTKSVFFHIFLVFFVFLLNAIANIFTKKGQNTAKNAKTENSVHHSIRKFKINRTLFLQKKCNFSYSLRKIPKMSDFLNLVQKSLSLHSNGDLTFFARRLKVFCTET